MHVLIAGRQEGKTTSLIDWVKEGVPVKGYPGWSRIAVVINLERHYQLKAKYWNSLDDFDHRVYTLSDIQKGRFTSYDAVYRLDDLDVFIRHFISNISIDGFTITAESWDQIKNKTKEIQS